VEACDDEDVFEKMGLYLLPNFFTGDPEARLTRKLPRSDIGGEQGAHESFPSAVNWLL